MDSTREAILKLYEERGELLDTAAIAAINERPFYLQKELDDINDQIKALEGVLIGELLTTPQIETRYNPALLGGVRFQRDPRTASEREWDEAGEDWNRQMKELLS